MENERNMDRPTTTGGLGLPNDTVGGTTRPTDDLDTGSSGGFDAASTPGLNAGPTDRSRNQRDEDTSVKDKAKQMRDRATEKVESRVSDQKHRAAGSLDDLAQGLRTAGQQLPPDNGMSSYMVRAADQVEHLAGFLDNQDVSELVDNVEHFARRQPAAFLGGAFALGILGARFLKSSRRDLVDDRLRDDWSTRRLTGRVDEPEDAISRPQAPGYAPPDERDLSSDGAGGYR